MSAQTKEILTLLNAKNVAAMTNKPVKSIYDLARRNLIPNIRIGKSVRFHPDKLKEWLDAGGSRGAL
jgi:excisionase family DNA binding protein